MREIIPGPVLYRFTLCMSLERHTFSIVIDFGAGPAICNDITDLQMRMCTKWAAAVANPAIEQTLIPFTAAGLPATDRAGQSRAREHGRIIRTKAEATLAWAGTHQGQSVCGTLTRAVRIEIASSTDLATPVMPPASASRCNQLA